MNKEPIRKIFREFDRVQFADWLWRGLQSFYALPPSDRAMAFDHVGLQIIQQESICAGLALIYEEFVPEPNQLIFRQAIGDVMRKQGNNPNAPESAFSDLIYLLMRIRATESLSALLPAVGNGLIGKRCPDILYETITALKSLAPSTPAHDTARDLIDSINFDEGYLFEATKVLIECEPSRISQIVLDFEPRLSQLRETTYELGGNEWTVFCEAADDWARHILLLGPISSVQELWIKADHSTEQVWLFELLFTNNSIPIDFIHDQLSDKYFIKCCGKKVQLNISDKDYWTRRKLLSESARHETEKWLKDPDDIVNKAVINLDDKPETGEEEIAYTIGSLIGDRLPFIVQQDSSVCPRYQTALM